MTADYMKFSEYKISGGYAGKQDIRHSAHSKSLTGPCPG